MVTRLKLPVKLLIFCSIFFALGFGTVYAETDYSVPVRADGRICQDFGPIAGLRRFTEPAGILYFWDHGKIDAAFSHAGPFVVYGYDNDGNPFTPVAFLQNGAVVASAKFKTGNNEWTATGLDVPAGVDRIQAAAPGSTPSSWACFIDDAAPVTPTQTTGTPTDTPTTPTQTTGTPTASQTPTQTTVTPTDTPTPTASQTPTPTSTPGPKVGAADVTVRVQAIINPPTDLTPTAAPTAKAALVDDILYVSQGVMITATINVVSNGPDIAQGVVITALVNGLVVTIPVGDIAQGSGQVAYLPVKVLPGTNLIEASVGSTTEDTNPRNNHSRVVFDGFGCSDGSVFVENDDMGSNPDLCPQDGESMIFLPVVKR